MRRLPVRVDSHLAIGRSDLKAAGLGLRDLREPFEYDNPEFWKRERLGFFTGDTPRKISLVETDSDEIRLPRGVLDRLLEILARERIEPEFEDKTVSGTEWMLSKVDALSHWVAPFELDPDQRSAAKACVRRRTGLVVGPCASGKTEVALKAISLLGEKAIVVVHTERILKSWIEKATERFPNARVGAFYGKRKQPDADVVVGMVRTVLNHVRREPGWTRLFGTFVLDEAHHCPATTFSEVVAAFPARNRLAFTATPRRKDAKETLLYDAFGAETKRNPKTGKTTSGPRVLFRITDEMLERFGRIMPIEVVVVPTEFYFDLDRADELAALDWTPEPRESTLASVKRWVRDTADESSTKPYAEMLDEMVRDRKRQARILSYLLPEIAGGRPSMLLADRREFCLELRNWLRRRNVDVGTLMGGKNRGDADRTEDALNAGKLLVAVGTTVADEGMDVGCLARGFGCTPVGSNPGRLTQQFGRFKRLHAGKADAKYFYFWDRRITGLRRHLRTIANVVGPPHTVWWSEEPGKQVRLTKRLITEIERR